MAIFKSFFNSQKVSNELLDEIENILINADLGVSFTNKILNELRKTKYNKNISIDEIREIVANYIREELKDFSKEFKIIEKRPFVLMFIGVNGAGKTTTIGKLANKFKNEGKKVVIAACDTFRIGAVEQLSIWCKSSGVEMVQGNKEGQDPASVAYNGYEKAKQNNYDILIIDTAGRMQNNINLMNELQKIAKVVSIDEIILVLDATTGQNALKQVEQFNKFIKINGLIINKMDGSSKGGVLLPIYENFKKNIYFVGVGEKINDLKNFDLERYINQLLN